MRVGTRDIFRRHFGGLLVITPRDPDQPSIVAIFGQAFSVRDQRVDQFADRRRDRTLMGEPR